MFFKPENARISPVRNFSSPKVIGFVNHQKVKTPINTKNYEKPMFDQIQWCALIRDTDFLQKIAIVPY